RCMRTVAAAMVATPALLALAVMHGVMACRADDRAASAGADGCRPRAPFTSRWLSAFTTLVYSQERLGRVLSLQQPLAHPATSPLPDQDVLGIGCGPGGTTTATLLAPAHLTVGLVERETFPRFHVGESLLPANVPLFERLGVLEALRARGFITKSGAFFHD